jgi:hypothetical protein
MITIKLQVRMCQGNRLAAWKEIDDCTFYISSPPSKHYTSKLAGSQSE